VILWAWAGRGAKSATAASSANVDPAWQRFIRSLL
jgi:hypothetical protein